MKIILSHRYLDFDALASMVAAQKIYPDGILVMEGSYGQYVQDFLSLAKEQIPYQRLRDLNPDEVEKIILVDTYELKRAVDKDMRHRLKDVPQEIIDHHPYQQIPGTDMQIETVGACTTLLVEKIISKGLKLTGFEATLLALGIFDDTGSFIFENTTSRDLRAAAFLLDRGAQLSVISEYLRKPLTKEQMELFQELLDNGITEEFDRTPVYISHASCEEYFGGLALLAHRIGEIESADIWFIVVQMENRIYLVGRARGIGFPVNKIVQAFGGSGHEKAGSAVIKNSNVDTVIAALKNEILSKVGKPSLVRDIMSFPVKNVSPETTIEEVGQQLLKYGHTGVTVVDDDNLVGVISRRDVDKAIKHGLNHAPVKGFMTKEVISVHPEQSWEEVQELMVEHDIGRLPVVQDGQVVGIVSRSDVMRLVYGSAVPTAGQLARERSLARREDTLKLIDNLPGEIRQVLDAINETARELEVQAYLVGGFVRDLLLNVPSTDLDVVVVGDGLQFAEHLNDKLHPLKLILHKPFGTARLLWHNGTHLDISGSRREDYDFPGALPTVEESTLRDDLYRRDFTINAMALCLNESCYGELIDFYGGFRDLQQGEIRFLHNLSFIEDPTRILRAVRFAGRYNFKLAKITRDGIATALEAKVLKTISPNRFTEELMLIYGENAYQSMGKLLRELGIYQSWFEHDYPWDYSLPDEEVQEWNPEKRWLVSLRKMTETNIPDILKQLTLTKNMQAITLEYHHLRQELKPVLSDMGQIDDLLKNVPEVLLDVLMTHEEYAASLKQYIIALDKMKMKTTGSSLLERGFPEGPVIGEILKQIRLLWLAGEIKTDEEEEKYIQKVRRGMYQ